QQANEAKWEAMDRLEAIRKRIAELIVSNPESVLGLPVNVDAVELVVARCPRCASLADELNDARRAMRAAQLQLEALEQRRRTLDAKKDELEKLGNELDAMSSTLSTLREGLSTTWVPLLGAAPEIENMINLA